jgi:hypothetical protein
MLPPGLLLRPSTNADSADRAVATLHRVLASLGWDESKDLGSATVEVDLDGTDSPVREVVAAIEPHSECFIATFDFGEHALIANRGQAMRFVTRANWNILVGNFELDLDSGAVRFRTSLAFTGGELAESSIRSALGTAMGIVEAYADALRDVIEGRSGADAALARAEAEKTSDA